MASGRRYTVNMIAQRLRTTHKTIKEISVEMDFSNESYFGKFFKKYMGCSPAQYRNKMRHDSMSHQSTAALFQTTKFEYHVHTRQVENREPLKLERFTEELYGKLKE